MHVERVLVVLGVGLILSCLTALVTAEENRNIELDEELESGRFPPEERMMLKGKFMKYLKSFINSARRRQLAQSYEEPGDEMYGDGNYEGDIQLTKEQLKWQAEMEKQNGQDPQKRKFYKFARIWPGKTVYYEPIPPDSGLIWLGAPPFCGGHNAQHCRDRGLTYRSSTRSGCWFGQKVSCLNYSYRNAILAGMRYIEQNTCIKFRERAHGTRIKFVKGNGCHSSLGMITPGPQIISLHERGCVQRGTVVHELLHSLGFHHEQSRPDRDQYITVHVNNILPEMRHNFAIQSYIDSRGVPYDIQSLLQYGSKAFSANGQPTITAKNGRTDLLGQRVGMTYNDRLLVNRVYGC